MTVTLRNLSADDVTLWAPGGAPGAFAVAGDDTVEVPGEVLGEGDDYVLIGPEGTTWDEDEDVPGEVRAWPTTLWAVESGGTPQKGGEDDA
jgi:hypothetical protein